MHTGVWMSGYLQTRVCKYVWVQRHMVTGVYMSATLRAGACVCTGMYRCTCVYVRKCESIHGFV